MSITFDEKHTPPKLEGKVYIRLAKNGQLGYHMPNRTGSSSRRVGPFPTDRKLFDLIYKLLLPSSFKMHPVVLVTHLEQCHLDEIDRPASNTPAPVLTDEGEEFVVEKLLKASNDGQRIRAK